MRKWSSNSWKWSFKEYMYLNYCNINNPFNTTKEWNMPTFTEWIKTIICATCTSHRIKYKRITHLSCLWRREDLPWLYYESTTARAALESTELSQQFGRGSELKFRFAEFSLNGSFLGLANATNGRIQLCRDSLNELNAAYVFGTQYSQSVSSQLSITELIIGETSWGELKKRKGETSWEEEKGEMKKWRGMKKRE